MVVRGRKNMFPKIEPPDILGCEISIDEGVTMDAKALKAIRTGRGLSQPALAAMISAAVGRDYQRSAVAKWEGGHAPIPDVVQQFLLARFRAAVITLTNQKGGVAKTTSTVSLAYAIGKMGYRVLMVDCDPQANATMLCGIDPVQLDHEGRSLHDLLFEREDLTIHDVIQREKGDVFDVLPTGLRLSQAQAVAAGLPNREGRLKIHLDQVRPSYDIIIIDTGPNLEILTLSALHAATAVIIPTQLAPFAIYGATMTLGAIDNMRKYGNPTLKVLGILPTQVNMARQVDRKLLSECSEQFPNLALFKPVPITADVDKAIFNGEIALAKVPKEHPLRIYEEIATAIVAMTIGGQQEKAR